MSEFPPRGALNVSFGEVCDRGKVREENQDSVRSAAIPLGDLFIVADGIGGYQGGATASRMVIEGFVVQLATRPANYPPDHALAEACSYTNASIHAAASTGDPSLQRMGSTVVLALIQAGAAAGGNSGEVASFGPTAWIGHVGDSRAYLVRVGQMTKITNDHSAVQALINRNLITEEEARNHPDASVLTRSLGHRPDVEIELDRVPLQPGDALLLCSDGLWGYVADGDIAGVATDPDLSSQTVAERLLDLALAAGGHDNIGIEFIRIEGSVPGLLAAIPPPARAATRTTLPEINTSQFGPIRAAAPPVPSAANFVPAANFAPAPAPASGKRNQLMLAVGLLLLAVCGVLGIAVRNRFWTSKGNSDGIIVRPAPVTPPSSGPENNATPRQREERTTPKRIPPGNPTPVPAIPAVQPQPVPAADPRQAASRQIGIVGAIRLGKFHAPARDEIELQHTVIRQESKAECVKLATAETVAYIARPDLTEHAIVEAIVKSYPEVKKHVKTPDVKRLDMTDEVKTACGQDYDAIVILAVQAPAAPAPAGTDPPANIPRPSEPQERPTAQLQHPHKPQEP